jgi:hypothetical protein
MYKQFLTLDEQLEYLKKNKRVVFNTVTEDEAKEFLLVHNYINVITPMKLQYVEWEVKNINGKRIPYPRKDQIGNHIYIKDIDFQEYINKFLLEKTKHIYIFKNIIEYEKLFNAIFSYYTLHYLNIQNTLDLITFLEELNNYLKKNNPYPKRFQHFESTINKLRNKVKDSSSCYIFFNSLNFSELLTIYILSNMIIKKDVFLTMNNKSKILIYNDIQQVENSLFKLVAIRNCVCHGDSLEILKNYYNVKKNTFRHPNQKKQFERLINKLSLE